MNLAVSGFRAPYKLYDHDAREFISGEYETWDAAKAAMAVIRGFQHNLQVEGLEYPTPDACWSYEGNFPPFVIFDIDVQRNLQPYYATRAQAEIAMARILKGD